MCNGTHSYVPSFLDHTTVAKMFIKKFSSVDKAQEFVENQLARSFKDREAHVKSRLFSNLNDCQIVEIGDYAN